MKNLPSPLMKFRALFLCTSFLRISSIIVVEKFNNIVIRNLLKLDGECAHCISSEVSQTSPAFHDVKQKMFSRQFIDSSRSILHNDTGVNIFESRTSTNMVPFFHCPFYGVVFTSFRNVNCTENKKEEKPWEVKYSFNEFPRKGRIAFIFWINLNPRNSSYYFSVANMYCASEIKNYRKYASSFWLWKFVIS